MNCPACGNENMEGSERCWKCDERLRPAAASIGNQWIVLAVAGVAVVIFVGMMLSSTRPTGGSSGATPVATATASAGASGSAVASGAAKPATSAPATAAAKP